MDYFRGGAEIVVMDDPAKVPFSVISRITDTRQLEDSYYRHPVNVEEGCQIIILSNNPYRKVIETKTECEMDGFRERFNILSLYPGDNMLSFMSVVEEGTLEVVEGATGTG